MVVLECSKKDDHKGDRTRVSFVLTILSSSLLGLGDPPCCATISGLFHVKGSCCCMAVQENNPHKHGQHLQHVRAPLFHRTLTRYECPIHSGFSPKICVPDFPRTVLSCFLQTHCPKFSLFVSKNVESLQQEGGRSNATRP